MFIEICLAIIAGALVLLIIFLARLSSGLQQTMRLIQSDAHAVSIEATQLLIRVNEFISTDLRQASQETQLLLSKLSDLTSDIDQKSHSLNALFKPLQFLQAKFRPDPQQRGTTPQHKTAPQIIRWIASSVILLKSTKEFIKGHAKRK